METYHHHHPHLQYLNNREKDAGKKTEGAKTCPTSPPSSSSSPSHEFSFTISLHSSSTTTEIPDKSRTPSSYAVDLSPADDIFFHGHLLPLQLLSHLPSSPRSSTNSLDSFTLPIRELLQDEKEKGVNASCSSTAMGSKNSRNTDSNIDGETKGGSKYKSFSLFGLKKGRKGSEVADKEDKDKQKKKLKFDVKDVLKKYMRMFFRGRREKLRYHNGQAYSYSGTLSPRNKPDLRGRRGQYSAPASMRTSPTNSGLLLATTALPPASDSTMEELQAAIQAAIAHCKNSIAKEDKIKC